MGKYIMNSHFQELKLKTHGKYPVSKEWESQNEYKVYDHSLQDIWKGLKSTPF